MSRIINILNLNNPFKIIHLKPMIMLIKFGKILMMIILSVLVLSILIIYKENNNNYELWKRSMIIYFKKAKVLIL